MVEIPTTMSPCHVSQVKSLNEQTNPFFTSYASHETCMTNYGSFIFSSRSWQTFTSSSPTGVEVRLVFFSTFLHSLSSVMMMTPTMMMIGLIFIVSLHEDVLSLVVHPLIFSSLFMSGFDSWAHNFFLRSLISSSLVSWQGFFKLWYTW